MVWGLFGWTIFLSKRFIKGNAVINKVATLAAQGNAIIGLVNIGLAAWTTFARDQCSVVPGYWHCFYDSSPSTTETWTNGLYQE